MINRLHYISQGATAEAHLDNIRQACDAGCTWVQLRIKNETPANITPAAMEARRITQAYGATLIINDHPQVAAACGADGVHVGLNDMSVADARLIVGPQAIVGGTSNKTADILKHSLEGADYVGLGPFRFTATKEKLSPVLGIDGYLSIMEQLHILRLSIPVIAIGGILEDDLPGLMQAGVHGVAISGLITNAAVKSKMVADLYSQLNNENYATT
ncbi:thiamine phosphate synthase [Chitinophaga sp. Cy-1792]|uniref:thiamine phosphate synthase n=1 Tax=Chitinophaga sp. Cy-1792 TaxID=2608339 RepID=UPI00142371AC|nr:thiamine phosphate synthase [Chitinophaga sp. Cy-1792]NIG52539.1 thiamine phosphate synthase [Chitinophaga sp. Cy-1792]